MTARQRIIQLMKDHVQRSHKPATEIELSRDDAFELENLPPGEIGDHGAAENLREVAKIFGLKIISFDAPVTLVR